MTDFTLTDYDGKIIEIGTKVHMWDDPEALKGVGTVTDLGEWDGDNDAEGRPIGIPPYITVDWGDGTTDRFVTSEWEFAQTGYYEREPEVGKVEEVVVAS